MVAVGGPVNPDAPAGFPACGRLRAMAWLAPGRSWARPERRDGGRPGRGDRRRGVRRDVHAASAAGAGHSCPGGRGGQRSSAAPGTGTATPAPAATSRACSIPTSSRMSCSRTGTGRSATPPSPRSCATPTTSPTASTSAATSCSIPGSRRRASTRPPGAGCWRRRTASALRARFCIMATGCLSAPNTPELAGLDDFAGPTYHTGRWPQHEVDFAGQRVAVIGTGSSAVQSIPVIARQAQQLLVFQRTPNYSIPAWNAPLEPDYVRKVKADYAGLRARARQNSAGDRRPLQPAIGAGGECRGTRARVRDPLARGRSQLHGRLRRSDPERGRQRDRRRLRPRPRSAAVHDPAVAAAAHPQDHHRLQAAVRRQRLFRDLQPRQRHPDRSSAREPIERITPPASALRAGTIRSMRWCSPPVSTP